MTLRRSPTISKDGPVTRSMGSISLGQGEPSQRIPGRIIDMDINQGNGINIHETNASTHQEETSNFNIPKSDEILLMLRQLSKGMDVIGNEVNNLKENVKSLDVEVKNIRCKNNDDKDSVSVRSNSSVVSYVNSLPERVESKKSNNSIVVERKKIIKRLITEKSKLNDITFDGKLSSMNPVKFLNKFEEIAIREGYIKDELPEKIISNLKGEARTWGNLIDYQDYEQFKEMFITRHWNDKIQQDVMAYLMNGRYEPKLGSMETYFLTWITHANYIDAPLTENWKIKKLILHFPERVYERLRSIPDLSVPIVISRLVEYDGSHVGLSNESSRGIDKPKIQKSGDSEDRDFKRNYYRKEYNKNENKSDKPVKAVEVKLEPKSSSRSKESEKKKVNRLERVEETIEDTEDSLKIEQVSNSLKGDSSTDDESDTEELKHYAMALIGPGECDDDSESEKEDDIRIQRKYKLPSIKIELGGKNFNALIDTGAEVSVVSERVIDLLKSNNVTFPMIPIKGVKIMSAVKNKGTETKKKVLLDFNCNKQFRSHKCYVVKGLAEDIILGLDFIIENRMALVPYLGKSFFDVELGNNNSIKGLLEENNCSDKSILINQIRTDQKDSQITAAVNKLLDNYKEIFQEGIGHIPGYKHQIVVKDDRPYRKPVYPIPYKHLDEVTKEVNKWEELGIIKRAPTEYINPLVVVVKPNGKLRICLDAREINDRMSADHARPPTIEQVFNKIERAKFFTSLDLSNAFLHVDLDEDSQKYTGFLFKSQTYVFLRLPFGLKTSGASFTRAMGKVLGPELEQRVIAYLDDVLIATKTWDEHKEILTKVLDTFQKNGIRLNREKSRFAQPEIKFLGHNFQEIKAGILQDTKDSIEKIKRPTNIKEVQSFLGLVNWDRRFIPNLSEIIRPIENLLTKDKKFVWGPEQELAFVKTKEVFQNANELFHLQEGLDFAIDTDASMIGIGARLYQYDKDHEYTIAYMSKSLKGPQTRYTTTERECLAVVEALKKWRVVLWGHPIRIRTDHKALIFISQCSFTSDRIARWTRTLQDYDITWTYRKGSENIIADALSRHVTTKENAERIEYRVHQIIHYNDNRNWESWKEKIQQAQQEDASLNSRMNDNPENFHNNQGIIWEKVSGKWRIPVKGQLVEQLIEKIHAFLIHFGTDKVIAFAKGIFNMENVDAIVRDIVASCELCQKTKYYTRATGGEQYYKLPTKPGVKVSLDLYGPLPVAKDGYKYVAVTMDQFSKLVTFNPIRTISTAEIVKVFENNYFRNWGKPDAILTDRGGQFLSREWANFGERNGIELIKTTPYNPQSNPVERVMRELGRVIRTYAHSNHTFWSLILKRAQDVLNSTEHSSTGCIPFYLHKDVEYLPLGLPDFLRIPEPETGNRQELIVKTRRKLAIAAAKRYKQFIKKNKPVEYQTGQKVLLRTHKLSEKDKRLNRKICLIYEGPYVIVDKPHKNVYTIGKDNEVLGNFNSRQIRPFRERRTGLVAMMAGQTDELTDNDSESKESQYSDLYREVPLIRGQVFTRDIFILVDTGAQVSVISQKYLDEIRKRLPYVITEKVEGFRIYSDIASQVIPVTERLEIGINIGQITLEGMFYVAKGLKNPMVLGMDLLTKYKMDLLLSKNIININAYEISIPIFICQISINPNRIMERVNEQMVTLHMMRTNSIEPSDISVLMELNSSEEIIKRQNELCDKILRNKKYKYSENDKELTDSDLKSEVLRKTRKICEDDMVFVPLSQRARGKKVRLSIESQCEKPNSYDEWNLSKIENDIENQTIVTTPNADRVINLDKSLLTDSPNRLDYYLEKKLNSPSSRNSLGINLSSNLNVENRKRTLSTVEPENHCSSGGAKAEPIKRRCAEPCARVNRGDERQSAASLGSQPAAVEGNMSDWQEQLQQAKDEEIQLRKKLIEEQNEINKHLRELVNEAEKTTVWAKTRKFIQQRYNKAVEGDVKKVYQAAKNLEVTGIPLSEKGKMTTTSLKKGRPTVKDSIAEKENIFQIPASNLESGQQEYQPGGQPKDIFKDSDQRSQLEEILKDNVPQVRIQRLWAQKSPEIQPSVSWDKGYVEVSDSSASDSDVEIISAQNNEPRTHPRYNLRKTISQPKVVNVQILKEADKFILKENKLVPARIRNQGTPVSPVRQRRLKRWSQKERKAEPVAKKHYKTRQKYSAKAKRTREAKKLQRLQVEGIQETEVTTGPSENDNPEVTKQVTTGASESTKRLSLVEYSSSEDNSMSSADTVLYGHPQ